MLGHGLSFSGGFQCLSVSDCSIANCDFDALGGKDVRVSFYSANPHLGLEKSTNNKCWRGCGEKEPFYFVFGNVNWCGHYREHWRFLKKLKIELSCDSAFLLLGVYLDKTVTEAAGDVSFIPGSGRSPEEGMATHSSIFAWRIPQTEKPGRLQSMGSQGVQQNCSNLTHMHIM